MNFDRVSSGLALLKFRRRQVISQLTARIRHIPGRMSHTICPFVNYSDAPSGRKYCVPLTGSWSRRSSCCRSELRSTKSMSEVLMTSRSDAA